jgi:hypothetical protein
MPLPRAPGPDPELTSVSCVSTTFCVAVGQTNASSQETSSDGTLAETWDGTRWSMVHTPNPSRTSGLSGVSCASKTFCVAVGMRAAHGGPAGSIAETWDGTRWRVSPTPAFPSVRNVGSNPAALSGVSCAAANACTAVGYYFVAYLTAVPLVDRWNGRRWTQQRAPSENKNRHIYGGVQDTSLDEVSCPTRSDYWAGPLARRALYARAG